MCTETSRSEPVTKRVAIRVAYPSNLKFPVYGSMRGRGGLEGEGEHSSLLRGPLRVISIPDKETGRRENAPPKRLLPGRPTGSPGCSSWPLDPLLKEVSPAFFSGGIPAQL